MVKAKELHRILLQALLAAGKDSTLPMICGVKIESRGGKLWATGTDRFRVHIGYADFEGEEFEAFVPSDALAAVVKLAKGGVRDERTVNVAYVAGDAVEFQFSDGSSSTVKADDVNFPAVRQLFTTDWSSGFEKSAYNGNYVADICKAAKLSVKDAELQWRFDDKGKLTAVADGFVAMLMPMRLPGDSEFSLPDGLSA